jgi:hypothetical protein
VAGIVQAALVGKGVRGGAHAEREGGGKAEDRLLQGGVSGASARKWLGPRLRAHRTV